MTTWSQLVDLDASCAYCRDSLTTVDASMILVDWPRGRAERLCLDCWAIIIAAALVAIQDLGDERRNASNWTLEQAEAAFAARDDRFRMQASGARNETV